MGKIRPFNYNTNSEYFNDIFISANGSEVEGKHEMLPNCLSGSLLIITNQNETVD